MAQELAPIIGTVIWQLMVAAYLYFVGISAGAFILSTLSYVLGFKRYQAVAKISLITAVVFALLAPAAIAPHLSQPSRLFSLLFVFHATSPLSWGVYILTFYVIMMLVYGRFAFRGDLVERMREKRGVRATFYKILALGQTDLSEKSLRRDLQLARVSGSAGLILAFLSIYTGFELGIIKAQPLWHLSISPLMFLITAVSSGFSFALVFHVLARRYFSSVKSWDTTTISAVGTIIAWTLFLFLGFNVTQAILLQYSSADARFAYDYLVSGPLGAYFVWIGLVLGGLVPLLILAIPSVRKSPILSVTAGILVLVGTFVTKTGILITAQLIPKASSQFLTYVPTLTEIAELVGLVGVGSFLFMVAMWVLPWETEFRIGGGR